MRSNRFIYHLVWIIGAFLLMYSSSLTLDYLNRKVAVTYDATYAIWGMILIAFVSGMYLGVINGLPRRFKVNKSQLIIFIPSFLVLIYMIVPYYIEIPYYRFYLELTKHNEHFFLGVISGMTFITGFFDKNANK
ncbi:hypothetical protein [Paenibacillus segetis]|uniref:Uncharacterized protein n=1 Tax=Paenibacillus segetis TaxID=1325360 RepID=A0ABQ1YJK5_9BACL|nr:hypothetical protein [Paenibacillus segetis]GGH27010.1 hypothetical protein GCM10008013_28190 [Paenibacillus segetis]